MKIRALIILLMVAFDAGTLWAAPANFLVLGVIASEQDKDGVALMKDMSSSKTFAVRQNEKFGDNYNLVSVGRKTVELLMGDRIYKIRVGGDTQDALENVALSTPKKSFDEAYGHDGVARDGNVVNVAKDFKEHLINNSLAKILMQAAAVPHFVDGRLQGFQLWEIEPASVFELAGLKDGDLIVAVNGSNITDVGVTIKQLNSLRSANEATFDFVRNGIKQQLKIVVQ